MLLSNEPLGVMWVLCIPCPPPLIADTLFGISSLDQLDPLTGAQRGVRSTGIEDMERWGGGGVGGPPSLSMDSPHLSPPDISCFCVSHSNVNLLHLTPAQGLQHPCFERTNGRYMQRFI